MALNGKPTFQKRSRPQLSCKFCRTGKLKCDRNSPCNQCIKRSRESQCAYLAPPPRKSKPTKNTKDRIAHLEDLVIQLINQNNDASGERSNSSLTLDNGFSKDGTALTTIDQSSFIKNIPSRLATDGSDAATAFGQMKITHGSTSYVGAAHWEAILNGVCELVSWLGYSFDRLLDRRPESDFQGQWGIRTRFIFIHFCWHRRSRQRSIGSASQGPDSGQPWISLAVGSFERNRRANALEFFQL